MSMIGIGTTRVPLVKSSKGMRDERTKVTSQALVYHNAKPKRSGMEVSRYDRKDKLYGSNLSD